MYEDVELQSDWNSVITCNKVGERSDHLWKYCVLRMSGCYAKVIHFHTEIWPLSWLPAFCNSLKNAGI